MIQDPGVITVRPDGYNFRTTSLSLSRQLTGRYHLLLVVYILHPTASHEIDGVRKEKERLTAAWTSHTFGLTAHFSVEMKVLG